jgi:hypothetical protein
VLDAVDRAVQTLHAIRTQRENPEARAVVVLTDGQDTVTVPEQRREIIQKIRETAPDVRIYVIPVGRATGGSQSVLTNLAGIGEIRCRAAGYACEGKPGGDFKALFGQIVVELGAH